MTQLSSDQYSLLLQALSDLGEGVVVGEGERIMYANDAFCAMSGYSLPELLALPSVAILAPEDCRLLSQGWLGWRESEQGGRFECALRHKDGHTVHLDISSKTLQLTEQSQFISIVRDITQYKQIEVRLMQLNDELESRVSQRTAEIEAARHYLELEIAERKQAEEALYESQHLLLSIAETTPDLIQVWDIAAQRDIFVNRATPTALGYSTDETERLGASSLAELLHPDDVERVAAIRENYRHLRAGEVAEYDYRLRHADSTWRWFSCRALVLSWATANQPKLVVGTSQDITERKHAEEALTTANAQLAELNKALQHSRDLLRTLFDTLQDGLVLVGQQGQVLALNESFAALVGESAIQLVRQSWPALCASMPALWSAGEWVLEALRDGRIRQGRERITLPNGELRIFDIEVIPIFGVEQSVEQAIVHTVDVTERLQIEAQMIEQERFAANGRLAATIAHEVNTPLQAVESCLHLVERAEASRRAEYLQIAREEVIRVGRILQQLLEVFRPSEQACVPIDINALIGRVLLLIGSTLARQGIDVERELKPDLPVVWGHIDEITQVLLNLVVNASHAMPKGGTLCLKTCDADGVLIEVGDTGIGMSAELQSRIFEPFFTTKSNGTGLGLAISQKIVARHGGHITVQSRLNAGSKFRVVLPVGDAPNVGRL